MKYKLSVEARKYFVEDFEGKEKSMEYWYIHGVTEAALEPINEKIKVDLFKEEKGKGKHEHNIKYSFFTDGEIDMKWAEFEQKLEKMLNGELYSKEEIEEFREWVLNGMDETRMAIRPKELVTEWIAKKKNAH